MRTKATRRLKVVEGTDNAEGPNPYSQAILRMVPKVGPVMAQLRDELHARDQQRYKAFREALEADIDLDLLGRLLTEHEQFGDLLRDSIEAALRTRDLRKIRLLAKAFVAGTLAQDQARVDEAEQQTRLIAELDPVDLRAVLALRDSSGSYGSPVACIRHELGLTPATAALVYARLERNALVETEAIASFDPDERSGEIEMDETWGLSATARAMLVLMDQLGNCYVHED